MEQRYIVKRDGRMETWSTPRIGDAIFKAFKANGIKDKMMADRLADQVEKAVFSSGTTTPLQEYVQDCVENVLMDNKLYDIVRSYVRYREQRRIQRETVNSYSLDSKKIIEAYMDRTDWRINENSNISRSFSGLVLHMQGEMQKNYILNQYPKEIRNAHIGGYFHIHDLTFGMTGYCFTGDTRIRLLDGSIPTLEELAKYKANDTFWVFSRDEVGDIVPGKARRPRLTRKNADIVAVEISGGEIIRCTPDHKFMMRDGSYKEAKDLRKDDSLMPLYLSKAGNYLRVQDSKLGINDYVHRRVALNYYNVETLDDKAVHHINEIKMDNRPENLQIMDDSEHRSEELKKTRATEKFQIDNRNRMIEYNKSPLKKLQVSYMAQIRDRNEKGQFYNHTVLRKPYSVGKEDVYCLTVDVYENFALASGVFVHNCSGWSLRDLLLEGFNNEYAPNACSAGPAKHFDAALGQMVNFLGTLQNEWAGAQALNNVDTYLAPFVRIDKLTYDEVKQDIQKFVYNMNTTSRWGSQSPFTNITLDMICPKHIANEAIIVGGELQDSTYGEYQEEIDMINKAFIEIYTKGDRFGKLFSFPIPTYNVTKDFPWDSENGELLLKMTAKYGIPYFQNFINSDLNPEDVRSMCPLHPDEHVMIKVGDVVSDKTILECWSDKDTNDYEVYYKGNWYPATMVSTKSVGCIKITLKNSTSVVMDLRHEQPIKASIEAPVTNLRGRDLIAGMLMPTSMGSYNGELFIHRTDPTKVVWEVIDKIEDFPYTGDVYCFVVDNKEHLFTLSNGIITHNCRLQMDLRELRKRTGGLFGAGDLTGSIGVVTLNLSKLGYIARDEQEFLQLIEEYAELAKDSLELKRKIILENLRNNQMPWTRRYLKNEYKGHFSTIGIVGGHEACMNLLHKGIDTKEGTELMIHVLNHLRNLTSKYQEETGNLYNLEATPAEGVCYRLAKIDRDLYGKTIYISGTDETPYYTNSTNLPVGYTDDIFAALEHQNKLQPLYTGGTVFHSFLGESVTDIYSLKNYILKAFTLTKIPYISITPTFSVCKDHGYVSGEHFTCPTCGKATEVYTRIVGYYRPISQWNIGKKQEYKERVPYNSDTTFVNTTSSNEMVKHDVPEETSV